MTRSSALVIGTVLTGLLAGCSQLSRTEQSSDPLKLQAADSGKSFSVAPGSTVQVTLNSNASTGYSWKLAQLDAKVAEKTEQKYVAPDAQVPGAGGQEVWSFKALAAGQTSLRLEYVRPWETNTAPARTFEASLTVR